jgi:hypothetical protein
MIDYCNGCDKPLLPGRQCKNCESSRINNAKQDSVRTVSTVFNSVQKEVMQRAQQFANSARQQNMSNEEFCKQHLQDSGYLKQFKLKFNNQQKSN